MSGMEKQCRVCGLRKSVDEFYAKPNMSDGYDGRCKACVKVRSKELYQINRTVYLAEKHRKYQQDPERYRRESRERSRRRRAAKLAAESTP